MSTAIETPEWLKTCLLAQKNNFNSQKWLQDLQEQQGLAFLQRGIPLRREEQWKYTDVSYLQKSPWVLLENTDAVTFPTKNIAADESFIQLVFVNGHFSEKLSTVNGLPAGVLLCPLDQAIKQHEQLVKPHLQQAFDAKRYPFASLSLALMTNGVFLFVPKNITVSSPIRFLFLNSKENNYISCPRNLIIVGENSEAIILEEHQGLGSESYFTNVVTNIHAEQGARIQYHKIQNESTNSTHIAQIFVDQKQDSSVTMTSLAVGGNLSRDEVFVKLMARGAECSANGFYFVNNNGQHIDNHVQIDHVAEHGTSEMVYKGVLDKKSRAVFNGKIYVHPNAQKTVAHQENHNLLLSSDAEIDTKPELEIYADDVKCAHGDTVGQLDKEALFYLRSRGIDKNAALQLLTHAFADEVINRVKIPVIKQRMCQLLNEKMNSGN